MERKILKKVCPICKETSHFFIESGKTFCEIGTGCEHVFLDGNRYGFLHKTTTTEPKEKKE